MNTPVPDPSRFALPILSAANFVIGMGAFMVIGLLIPVADAFSLSTSTAGLLMTLYATSYAVLSPLLVSLTGAVGRRRILAAGLSVFAAANLLAALAPDETVLFAARVLAAAGAGLVTPVAAAVAAGLSAPDRQGRALTAVFFGFTLSQVVGVPAGGFIAYTFGWRSAFALVAVMALPIIALIWLRIPAGLSFRPVSLADLRRTLGHGPSLIGLGFTVLFVSGTYVVYTYISPLMNARMGFGRDGITLMLLLFGLGAVIGNLFAGPASDRIGTFRTLAILALVQTAILPWFSALPLPVVLLLGLCIGWSAFGWSFTAPQQARLIAIDPANASVILALNAGCIYLGSAFGSWVGGVALASAGLDALGFIGGGVVCSSLIFLIASERIRRRRVAAPG